MKIFSKTHFWKDHRTFIELEAKDPEREGGYPKEGSLVLKIGEQSTIKNAFKLSSDEARALRDSLTMFIKKHDELYTQLLSEGNETMEPVKTHISDDEKIESSLTFLEDNPKEENNEAVQKDDQVKRARSEFYF